MMQITLSPYLLIYASMTDQGAENFLPARFKNFLTPTGILFFRAKLLLQKPKQITLSDIELDKLQKLFTLLDYFHLYNVQIFESF